MQFEKYRLSDKLKNNIQELGFKKPTDIQYKAIPPILNQEDVLAIAQTGTGKTAAFAIPILERLTNHRRSLMADGNVRCLVMAPTHELANQTAKVFRNLGRNLKTKIVSIHGGVDQQPQIEQLRKGADVLIATPGRMFDLVSQKVLNLRNVDILVLDEADHMLDIGFIDDIRDLMRLLPRNRQTLFFSATINAEIKKLAYSLVRNAIRIEISPKNLVAKNVDHSVAFIEMDDKRFFLSSLIKAQDTHKILVFVRTKVRAERVKAAMLRESIETDTIHSDREQNDRREVIEKFRSGELKVLITTDVTARGIDIPQVEYVVNYDLPEKPESYVHRVGRTGRGNNRGKAISFCSKEEKSILHEIEKSLGKEIIRVELTKNEYQKTIDIVNSNTQDLKSLLKAVEGLDTGWKKNKKKKK